ncbi:MAG: hypothetical protein INH37_23750 [Myxococcaceae bacterium]|nr:hypothetical protein [Myxococcaceae bacterium]
MRRFVFRVGDGVVGVGRSVTVGRKAAWGAKTPWKLVRWVLGLMEQLVTQPQYRRVR